jgi:hypothetical protein
MPARRHRKIVLREKQPLADAQPADPGENVGHGYATRRSHTSYRNRVRPQIALMMGIRRRRNQHKAACAQLQKAIANDRQLTLESRWLDSAEKILQPDADDKHRSGFNTAKANGFQKTDERPFA